MKPVEDWVLDGAATGSVMHHHEIESAAAELLDARDELTSLRALAERVGEYLRGDVPTSCAMQNALDEHADALAAIQSRAAERSRFVSEGGEEPVE